MLPAAADEGRGPTQSRAIAAERLTSLEEAIGNERELLGSLRDDFLADEASEGRVHDELEVTALIDSATGAAALHLPGVEMDALHVQEARDGDSVQAMALGAESHNVDTGSDARGGGRGMGWAGGPSATGYLLDRSGSLRLTRTHDADLNADFSSYDHFVETWYWKYVLPESKESTAYTSSYRSNSDFWAYSRRGIADGASNAYHLRDLTIRSRPWGGTSSRIRNYIDRLPATGTSTCTSAGSLSFSYGGFGVSLPVSTCQNTQGVNNTSVPLEFGTDWSGSTASKVGVEAMVNIRSVEGQVPTMADYIWAEFYGCNTYYCNKDYIKWNDTGW